MMAWGYYSVSYVLLSTMLQGGCNAVSTPM